MIKVSEKITKNVNKNVRVTLTKTLNFRNSSFPMMPLTTVHDEHIDGRKLTEPKTS